MRKKKVSTHSVVLGSFMGNKIDFIHVRLTCEYLSYADLPGSSTYLCVRRKGAPCGKLKTSPRSCLSILKKSALECNRSHEAQVSRNQNEAALGCSFDRTRGLIGIECYLAGELGDLETKRLG